MTGSLGHIAATVSLDINPFKASATALNSSIKAIGNELRAQKAAFGDYSNNLNKMKSVYSTMGRQMDVYKEKLAQQKKAYQEAADAAGKNADGTQKVTAKMANAASNVNKTAYAMQALEKEYTALNRQIALGDSSLGKFGHSLETIGSKATNAGQKLTSMGSFMTTRVTAPIVAGFGYAAKSAIDFNSEIEQIGPLLTNGAAVTGKFRTQLDQMSSSSKKWSTEFGVSTTAINQGLADMVRRGYSASQAMGAMPSVLSAAKASGDDFNVVMNSTTSILEAFGMKVNSTNGMIKNTSHVTDVLTHVANATASGFEDMGEAMSYVGPSAHAAGISLEETAAAIGLMSNNGIEGSMAGTTLRRVLEQLMNPSKQSAAALESMGVSAEAFKNHALTLPQLIDKIKNNTKGWTKEQRAAAIAQAFGSRAQAGMNVLVEQGSGALKKLTTEAKNSNGETKKISETMNETAQAKVARFKESLHVLAINIGDKLVPAIMPLIEDLKNMVEKFGKLDSGTQQFIVTAGALVAAVGPLSLVLGGAARGLGALATGLSSPILGLGRMVVASGQGATGLQVLKSGFSKASYESMSFGKSTLDTASKITSTASQAKTATGGVKTLGAGFLEASAGTGALAAGLTVAGVAIAAIGGSFYVYENKIKPAQERTKRWGTDVGEAADKALSKMKGFSNDSTTALDGFDGKLSGSATNAEKAFGRMSDAVKGAVKKQNAELDNWLKSLPENVRNAAQKGIEAQKDANNKAAQNAEQASKEVNQIYNRATKEKRKLTSDENAFILSKQKEMNEEYVNQLKLSGSQRKKVLAALNQDVSKMSQDQARDLSNSLYDMIDKQSTAHEKAVDDIGKHLKKGSKAYKDAMKAEYENFRSNTDGMATQFSKAMSKNGASVDQIAGKLKQMGYSSKDAMTIAKQAVIGVGDATNIVSTKANKAAKDWNKMVWDDKNATVKSNAQEEVNKAGKSNKGWKQLKYDLKHADLSSNAKAMIGISAIENGRWNSLTWSEKKAMIVSKGGEELVKTMEKSGEWNQLSMKTQEAILQAKGKQEIVDILAKSGEWNLLSLKEQTALVKDKATPPIITALTESGKWNNLPMEAKDAIVNAKGMPQLADAVIKYGLWNDLPENIKKLLVANKDAKQALKEAGISVDQYDKKNPSEKHPKVDPSNAVTNSDKAKSHVEAFDKKKPGSKNLKALDNASGPAGIALRAVNRFPVGQKVMNLITNYVSKFIKKAKGDNDFQGGGVMVNDESGSIFRELIRLPNGDSFIPQGRNVTMALPAHSQIIPARETNRLLGGIPQFASGTPGYSTVVNELTSLRPEITGKSENKVINNTPNNTFNVSVNVTGGDNPQDTGQLFARQIEETFRKMFNNESMALGGGSIA